MNRGSVSPLISLNAAAFCSANMSTVMAPSDTAAVSATRVSSVMFTTSDPPGFTNVRIISLACEVSRDEEGDTHTHTTTTAAADVGDVPWPPGRHRCRLPRTHRWRCKTEGSRRNARACRSPGSYCGVRCCPAHPSAGHRDSPWRPMPVPLSRFYEAGNRTLPNPSSQHSAASMARPIDAREMQKQRCREQKPWQCAISYRSVFYVFQCISRGGSRSKALPA